MDSNFNNENEPWEFSLDIDDSDPQLTPVVRSYSSTHVEPSPLTPNPVTITPSPAGIVQLSSSTRVEPSSSTSNPVRIIPGSAGLVQRAKLLKENVFILDPDGALMSTHDYMQKVVKDVGEDADFNSGAWVSATNYVNAFGGTVTGCLGDIDNFLKKGKLEQVVAIVKSCSPNALGDLNVTLKDLSGVNSRTTTIPEPTTLRESTISNTLPSFNSYSLQPRTVKFGNDQIASILGYGDLGNDLLTGSRGTDLYSITLQDTSTPNLICLMAKATSYTWTHFLRSKDKTPDVLIDFLRLVQRGLHGQVRIVRTDKDTEFLNKTLHAYFAQEGIEHQTSTARTPEQNGIVERRNHTLVEAARTMLSAAKVPLFFWAEAIATTCFTQNRSLVIPRHEKTPYHIINGQKPCIFVGYSTQSRAYRVYNKRTRVIVETIHVNFDELPQMASDHVSSDPVPQCPTTALEHDSLSPGPQSQENVPQAAETSSAVTATDAPNQHQQQHTIPSTSTTVAADTPPLNIQTTPKTTGQAPTVTANENIIQAETNKKHTQVDEDEFINIFSKPV
ncbi:putative ribonuclease H-like domain-containing protein [Tanacetum coccineum]